MPNFIAATLVKIDAQSNRNDGMSPRGCALGCPSGMPVAREICAQLQQQIGEIGTQLRQAGLSSEARIGVAFLNGP
jgi:hypothetical protein